MTFAQKIEKVLKDQLEPENIKTVIEMAEFLKYKENQNKWKEINESAPEYITKEDQTSIEEIKAKGEFIDQSKLLEKLGISKDEI
jgi:hypothetical protein